MGSEGPGREITVEPLRVPAPEPLPTKAPPAPKEPSKPEKVPA